jgi:hypothetical protein
MENEEVVKESQELGLKVFNYIEIKEAGRGKDVTLNPAGPDTIATF